MYFVVVVFIYSLNLIVYSLNSSPDPSPRGIYLFRKLSLQRQPPKSVCSGAGRAGFTGCLAGGPGTVEVKCFVSFYASCGSLIAFGKRK